MGRYLLIAVGLISPIFIVKYREMLGDTIGEADWMRKIGGVHSFLVIFAVAIFLWTIAEMTGTTGFLFGPLRRLSPGLQPEVHETF